MIMAVIVLTSPNSSSGSPPKNPISIGSSTRELDKAKSMILAAVPGAIDLFVFRM
jgi:hypothetical protein